MSDSVKVAVFMACLLAVFAAVCAVWAWMVATSDARIERAREQGRRDAQAEIDAAGGEEAWVQMKVDEWRAAHGEVR